MSILPLLLKSQGALARAALPAAGDERTLQIGDARVKLIDAGSGRAVLFLHGWPLNGTHWSPTIERVRDTYRCIAPDLMGLGSTEVPESQDLSPRAQAAMLLKLMDSLAIDAFHVVANDSGTCIAQLLAVAAPHRVESLLLTNGDVDAHSPPPALKDALAAARAGVLDAMLERHFSEPGFAESPQGLGGLCFTDARHLSKEAMERYFAPLLQNPKRRRQFQAYGAAFEPNPLLPLRERIKALPMPARMVWGTADIHFPVACAYWLDKALPDSRGVREVPGGKLFFTEEFPDLIAEEIRGLIAPV